MAIDILSGPGCFPVLVMDHDWLTRVTGFYMDGPQAYVGLLDPEGQLVLVRLTEPTSKNAQGCDWIYMVAINPKDEVVYTAIVPINLSGILGYDIPLDMIKAHIDRLVSRSFNLEFVGVDQAGWDPRLPCVPRSPEYDQAHGKAN